MGSLLEESTLVGEGHLCHIELRPQAYGVLAEVVHCLRAELSLDDLARIISIFIRSPFIP
jgi:transformation/transcription domain-associated protein